MELVVCNSCGSGTSKPILTGVDLTCHTPGSFTIVRCRECGLSYVNPRPAVSDMGQHYPQTYGEHTEAHLDNSFASTQADLVRSYFREPGAVLDIGCASGAFLLDMQMHEWRVAGTDTSERALALARSATGGDIRLGGLEPDAFSPACYDAVTLWSVFEHLHDPLATLRVVRTVIKPAGFLFLVMPNFRSLERLLFRRHWFALELPRHLYHFTPKTLDGLLGLGGFRIDTLRHSSGHDIFRASVRLIAGRSTPPGNGRESSGEGEGAGRARSSITRQINRALVGGFTRTADKLGMGSQLLVIARPC
jgi:SAM-dependent methyltransferase